MKNKYRNKKNELMDCKQLNVLITLDRINSLVSRVGYAYWPPFNGYTSMFGSVGYFASAAGRSDVCNGQRGTCEKRKKKAK